MPTRDFLTRITGGRFPGRDAPAVNGVENAVASGLLRTSSGPVAMRLIAYRMSDDVIYRFMMLTLRPCCRDWTEVGQHLCQLSPPIDRPGGLPSPLPGPDKTVSIGETARRLAYHMATPNRPLQRFLILNGLLNGQEPRPGSRVKIIEEGP